MATSLLKIKLRYSFVLIYALIICEQKGKVLCYPYLKISNIPPPVKKKRRGGAVKGATAKGILSCSIPGPLPEAEVRLPAIILISILGLFMSI